MPYAFTFDASACTGCKACQVACKDKNNLPAGVLWRRVYEVSGGSWQKMGDAWITDVFAYNLSMACNHCVHSKCAGVCPTDAYIVRGDGIVYIDESKCIGCGYCAWACPYSAPQYNPEKGKMAKCNFCFDSIDAGLPPACVAACPLRALDYISVSHLPERAPFGDDKGQGLRALWQIPATEHPFPLPDFSRTEPHLAIKLHAGMEGPVEKSVSNWEEVRPEKVKSELPLVAFTLLGQMAAGMALLAFFSGPLSLPVLITLGGLIGLAGLSSLLHLGSAAGAWRAIVHLKKSWLSREILVFVLFGGSWLLALAMPGMGKGPMALSGAGLVYSMAQVYRLRSVPAWNSDRTLLSFAASALFLGGLGLQVLELFTKRETAGVLPAVSALFALGVTLLSFRQDQLHQTASRLRLSLIVLAFLGLALALLVPSLLNGWILIAIFLVGLGEEGLGRWLFYEHLQQKNL